VIITSSSDAKLERARSLGANHLINYRTVPRWGDRARELTGGRGVDVVLEVGGLETLPQSMAALREGGDVAGIGLLAGTPFWQAENVPAGLHRIRVGSRLHFEELLRGIVATGVRPVVDLVYPFERLSRRHPCHALRLRVRQDRHLVRVIARTTEPVGRRDGRCTRRIDRDRIDRPPLTLPGIC